MAHVSKEEGGGLTSQHALSISIQKIEDVICSFLHLHFAWDKTLGLSRGIVVLASISPHLSGVLTGEMLELFLSCQSILLHRYCVHLKLFPQLSVGDIACVCLDLGFVIFQRLEKTSRHHFHL